MKKRKPLSLILFLAFTAFCFFVFLGDFGSAEPEAVLSETEDAILREAGDAKESDAAENETESKSESEAVSVIFVHVCGSVKKPGVYKLSSGSRVYEALEAAGGCSEDAGEDMLNLAGILCDGERVYVPSGDEMETASIDSFSHITSARSSGGDRPGDSLININTADIDTLKSLPGIGDRKAADIVSYREKEGAFVSCDEIKKVSGIGDSTYSRIEDMICVK